MWAALFVMVVLSSRNLLIKYAEAMRQAKHWLWVLKKFFCWFGCIIEIII